LQVHVAGDRLLDVQSNSGHPLACSGGCAGFETALRRLESPQRVPAPLRRATSRGLGFRQIGWPAASALVGEILAAYPSGQIAFVLGDYPDHLSDLVHHLALVLGGATVLRFSPSSLLDGRVTLGDAARKLFGLPRLPYFDLQNASLVFSFGASGDEPWLARFAAPTHRPAGAAWVQFAPVRPPLAAAEWVSLRPGSEALLAGALGRLIALLQAGAPLQQDLPPEVLAASQASAVPLDEIVSLARRFAAAPSPVAVPGAGCLSQSGGLAGAQAVLGLNRIAGSLGRPGGLYLTPQAPLYPELNSRTATLAEVQALLDRLESGAVKALFVHGVDLLADLPAGLDVARALQHVERIISFNPVSDETASLADLILPDHLPLEGWGYHKVAPAADRPLVSAIQPVFAPRHATRSTVDVLLDAVHYFGGLLAAHFPYRTELEFIRHAVSRLPWAAGTADPWAHWQAQGGWWPAQPGLLPPLSLRPPERLLSHAPAPLALDPSAAEFFLLFAQPASGEAGLPPRPGEPCRVGMHPAAARRLGLRPGDTVRLASASAEIEATVTKQPDMHPDTVVIPLSPVSGQKTLALVGNEQNESGDLALQSGRVRIIPVG
jgi:anaerobic selenocysteine-containing dehydrogenase